MAESVPPVLLLRSVAIQLVRCHWCQRFSFPHLLNDDVDYHQACGRCELLVRVTQDQHRRLCLLPRYDKRPKGARGLSLVAPFPELKLKAGDRLELCSGLPDVGAFFSISSFPPEGVPLLLWRAENETLCLRKCPLFNRDIGLNPNAAVALDLLHTNHLGVMLVYCRHVVWEFLRSGTWGSGCVEQNGEFQNFCFGSSVRVVGLVRVQAAEPPNRPRSIRQHGRSQIEDGGRRDLGNVVVLGELLEALIQKEKFARC